jgi:hypothetical protein
MMNRTQAQELAHIIRSDANWLNVSVRHASEIYNLVAPESDEYVCWIEGRTLRDGEWGGDIGSLQEWKQFLERTYKSSKE